MGRACSLRGVTILTADDGRGGPGCGPKPSVARRPALLDNMFICPAARDLRDEKGKFPTPSAHPLSWEGLFLTHLILLLTLGTIKAKEEGVMAKGSCCVVSSARKGTQCAVDPREGTGQAGEQPRVSTQ